MASRGKPKPAAGEKVPVQIFNPQNVGTGIPVAPLPAISAMPPRDPRTVFVQTVASGSSGIRLFSGYFSEDYLINELHGTAAADAYDKMRRSDAKMKMALNAVKTPIIASPWEIHPATQDNPVHKCHADFIDHVLFHDMDRPFSKTEQLSIADFGHCVHEVTHKPVVGHPIFGDYIGVKSLGWRSPRSILYWRVNPDDGSLAYIHQLVTGDLQRFVDIPGEFLLVNSLEKEGDLYEGVSLMRAAYGAWKRKMLYLKLMAIGSERNAIPTPTIEVPENKEKSVQYQNMVASLQNYTSHQNAFFAFPAGWKIDFMNSTFDPEKLKVAIEFENSEMVSAFMANFLLLGSTQTGSRAVSTDQSEFFLGAIQYVADEAVSAINHKLIPQLIKMNYGPQDAYPKLKITGISDKAGVELADALYKLTISQVIQPDDELEASVRKRYQFPKKSDKGVRMVQAPKAMQQGDNVHETDHPEDFEGKPSELREAIRTILLAAKKGKAEDDDNEEEALVQFQKGDTDNPCDVCDYLDGKIFAAEEAPELPLHPHCECELVPYRGKKRKSRVALSELVRTLESFKKTRKQSPRPASGNA